MHEKSIRELAIPKIEARTILPRVICQPLFRSNTKKKKKEREKEKDEVIFREVTLVRHKNVIYAFEGK